MEDEKILRLYFERNERAITETDKKYGSLCRSIALKLLGNKEDAEECVNDTYHSAWNRIPPEFPRCFAAFLGRITRNISVSRYRTRTAAKRDSGLSTLLSELEDCIPSAASTEESLETKELSRCISGWLDSIDDDDCALFVRRYWYGDSIKELSAQTGVSAQNLTQRLFKLRKNLKTVLEAEGVII